MLLSTRSRREDMNSGSTLCLDRLILCIATRDEAALAALYDATVTRVYSLALRIAGNHQDAEEITCDAYRQIWQNAHDFAPERGSATAWLLLIARSRALDCCRKKSTHNNKFVHPVGSDVAYTDCEDQSADRFIMSFEETSLVRRALSKLPRTRRAVIGLAFLEGLSHEEISARTGLALGTVKSHIRRGLSAMKVDLSGFGVRDEETANDNPQTRRRNGSMLERSTETRAVAAGDARTHARPRARVDASTIY